MKDSVVYLFGAGFSAPLGLPLMNDFLIESKDMFADAADEYRHFSEVFEAINRMSVLKNYFRADLFNIEEILSILEIDSFLGGERLAEDFRRYLCDVIEHYTPEIKPYGGLPSNWHRFAFGRDTRWTGFGYFFANLFGLRLQTGPGGSPTGIAAQYAATEASYSIVTLNYDRVPEVVSEFLNKGGVDGGPHQFARTIEEVEGSARSTPLAKLHGSSDTGKIVPPTWSKGTHPEIAPVWNLASYLLKRAHHIRIIGYSLPTADAYVRYLLKSAAMEAPHLKRIDVIGWESTGNARSRFDEFITFPRYRYVEGRTEDYLAHLFDHMIPARREPSGRWHDRLEASHENFMRGVESNAA